MKPSALPPFRPTRLARLLRLGALAGAGLFAATAHAETGPYRIGAGLSFARDDNLFRAPAGEETSDRITTYSIFGGVDETIGRQRLRANADLRRTNYDERGDLDHNGYGLTLGWSGATVGEVSWDLGYTARRSLASYTNVLEAERRVRNLETNRQATASVQVGLQAQWVAGLNASHRRIDYSAPEYADDQLRVDSVGANVLWNPLGPVSLSLGPRVSKGRYPQARDLGGGVFQADEFDRKDIDFGIKWVATGASTLNARLSLTRQTFDVLGDRDFEGATGQLRWQWQITGKTRLDAVLSRDTGSETSFFMTDILGAPQRGTGDNSRVTNSLAARIDLEATAKTSFALSGYLAERRLAASSRLGDGSAFVDIEGNERAGSVALSVRYTPTRNSVLGCEAAHHRRASSSVLSSSYRANTLGCSAQLAFDL
jgi:hypothetical protein